MKANRTMLFIACGGGLYWAASILYLTAWKSPSMPLGTPLLESLVFLVLVTVVCSMLALAKHFFMRRWQAALAIGGIASTALLIIANAVSLPDTPILAACKILLAACHHAGFILFWGLNYAVLSKADAEKTVLLSIVIAFALYQAGSLIPSSNLGFPLSGIMKIVAVMPFLLGLYELPVVSRQLVLDNAKLLRPFYISRAFFGFCLAPLFFLPAIAPAPLPKPLTFVAVIGCAACAYGAVAIIRRRMPHNSLLRIAPLLFLGLLMLPYIGSTDGLSSFASIAIAAVWISWITLSSVQLSDMKERVGLNEVVISFSEKAVVFAACCIGYFALTALNAQMGFDPALYRSLAPTICTYFAIVLACFLFSDLIEKKQQQRMVDKALHISKNQIELIYDKVASEYGLTERERDVLALIAKGHTRPHICKRLTISDSTAKTHIAHIYDKLAIHSREELYSLIEDEKKDFGIIAHIL